jgi:trigger factor
MLKTKEQVDPCTVELNIEVGTEQVAVAIEDAFKHFAKRVAVPGFRKGKAPRALVERYVDEESVRDHAARNLVPQAYEDAIKEAEIEPFDLPEVEIVQFENEQPFVFKATVPLPPKVELGDYVNLKIERMAAVVSDEDVDRQIKEMLDRSAKLEPVTDRPVQEGDVVQVELQKTDGDDSKPFIQVVQAGSNLPMFDEKFIGMTTDQEQVINIDYADDFPDKELAGTTLNLKTKVLEIKARIIPELNDEFAKSAGSDTAEDLKAMMKSRMQQTASEIADRQAESQIVWQIVENSQIHFPVSMVEHEAEHRLQDLLHRLEEAKVELSDYLEDAKKTFEELRAEFSSNAERDVKVNLALMEVSSRENITVTDEDVDAEIDRMAEERKVAKASMQAYIDRTDGMSKLRSKLLRNKVLDFLVKSSNITNVAPKGDSE